MEFKTPMEGIKSLHDRLDQIELRLDGIEAVRLTPPMPTPDITSLKADMMAKQDEILADIKANIQPPQTPEPPAIEVPKS